MKLTSFLRAGILSRGCAILVAFASISCQEKRKADQEFQGGIIFPYQGEHVHGPTVALLPGGDVLTAWFQGSGERWADDVRIMGSRRKAGDTTWSEPFLMADKKGFPDINPVLVVDPSSRLWLFWYPVLANQWETSLPMYRISEDYAGEGAPVWKWQDVLLVNAGDKTERGIQADDSFVEQVASQLEQYESYWKSELMPGLPDSLKKPLTREWEKYKVKLDSLSRGMNMVRAGRARQDGGEVSAPLGYPLTRRIGWQTKNKAVFSEGRMILPLYSDGLDATLFALTDDGGESWKFSNPVLGGAGIQATVVIKKNGHLAAYLRDNGPPPQRMQRTESQDNGLTWTIPKDDILPNPGAGFDAVTLSTGEWLMVFNDQEEGRYNLTAAISDDDGATWKWKRHIEHDTAEKPAASHYPSVIEGTDGFAHVVYSFHRNDIPTGKTIKYATFPTSWVKEN